jgi:ubiquitin-conjugating enzyme E2 Z
MTSVAVTASTVKRLISDIKDIQKSDLSKDGIYYKHDEENMLKGYALIIGPKDTPYAYGNFLFKFNFPYNYPHAPPKVTYHTNDGQTRFNPNLYKNGKVCISLLNKPLINEPGIRENHPDIENYNKIVEYRTLETAICNIMSNKFYDKDFEIFREEMKENFINNYDSIVKCLDRENVDLRCSTYCLSAQTNYSKLKNNIKKIYNSIC